MAQKIVCIAGSPRKKSMTLKALKVLTQELEAQGLEAEIFDCAELELAFPGRPDTADGTRLLQAVRGAAGIVLATPEYHGSFSASLKLAIENLDYPSALQGKPIALLGVASGRIGAIKSIEALRSICGHVGALTVPGSVSLAGVHKLFDAEGRCTDKPTEEALKGLAQSLGHFLRDFVCPKFTLEQMSRDSGSGGWPASV